MRYVPDWKIALDHADMMLAGLEMTLFISIAAFVLAAAVGLSIALLRLSKVSPLSAVASVYTQFFRGIPQFVFILWLYYGLAMLAGINFEPVQAGILALTMQYGGFLSETFRAGIQAIGKGQTEAAMSVGLTKVQAYRYIILPQALRIIIPPAANSFISILKDSSLVSVIGVLELMRVTSLEANLYFRPFEFYTFAALIYISLTFVFSAVVQRLEIRMRF